jgi:nicotinate-nucleotide adenylyltransferase
MRYGVFGGTFDPPHLGHVAFARAASEALALDEVLWVPANRNPDKDRPGQSSARARLRMVELCVADEDGMSVSDIELVRGGRSYTVDTLEELAMVRPGDYWLLVGADALASVPKWRRYEHLLRLCRFAACARASRTLEPVPFLVPVELAERTDVVPLEAAEVSSTLVRERVFHGHPVDRYLKPAVLNYIQQSRLYTHE